MQIDLEPRAHSHLYELKPLSKWWLAVMAALCVLAAFVNGFDKLATWGLLLFGAGFGFGVLLIFPRFWLSKISDSHR